MAVGAAPAVAGAAPSSQGETRTVTEASVNTAPGAAEGPFRFASSPEGGSVAQSALKELSGRDSGLEFRVGDAADAEVSWRLDDILDVTDLPGGTVVDSSLTLSAVDARTWAMDAVVFDADGAPVSPEDVDVAFATADAPASRMTYTAEPSGDALRVAIADGEEADDTGRTDHSTSVTFSVEGGLIGGVRLHSFEDLSWSSDAVHLEAERTVEMTEEPQGEPDAEPEAAEPEATADDEAPAEADAAQAVPEQTTDECPAPGQGSTVTMTFTQPTYPAGGPADAVFPNAGEYGGKTFDVVVTALSGTYLDSRGHHFRATPEGTLQVTLWDPNDTDGGSGNLRYNLSFYEAGTYTSGSPVPMTVEAAVAVNDFDYVDNDNHERLLIDADASVARSNPTDMRFIDGNDHFVRSIDGDPTQGGDRKNAIQAGLNGSSFDFTYIRRGGTGFQTQMIGNTDYFGTTPTTCVPGNPQPLMDIVKTADVDETVPGGTVKYTVTATNTGNVDYTGIQITDDLTGLLDDAAYNEDGAATAGTVSYAEPTLTWSGDLPIGATVSITYSVLVDDPQTGDYNLENAVSGPPGSPCPQNTERCSTTTPVKAIDIEKTSDGGNVTPGDTVTYTVTATNIGQVDYLATEITDDLTGVLDDAAYNEDGAATAGTVSFAEPTLTWSGDLLIGQSVTITYSVTVDDPPTGDKVLENAVTGPEGGPCPQDAERCTTTDPIRELDIVKTSDAQEVGPGDTVGYSITATNTGQVDYLATDITDDLTGIIDDAVYNGDAAATAGTVAYAEPTLTWTGDLLIGQSVTITYTVTVNDPLTGDNILGNVVAGPPGGPCPQDAERCTTSDPIKNLDLLKTSSVEEVLPGESVTYTVTLTNTGEVGYTGISIADDLTGVLDDAAYNEDGAATAGTVSYAEPTLTWTGDVPVGESVTITYSVTVNDPLTGDQVLVNAVTDEDGEPCPDDDPACTTTTPVKAMDIVKTDDADEVLPGDAVTYTITATNTGQVDYTATEISDDLTGVLDDATYNDDASTSVGAVAYTSPTITWTGDLLVGESVTVTYSVTVNDPLTGDHMLDNAVTGPPGGPCPRDAERCTTSTPVKALDIVKTVDVEETLPGGTVSYTVTATNIGEADYLAAEIGDDLTGVLDDAVYNEDGAASAGAVAYAEPILTWTGDLLVGESVTITYSVTVNDPPTGDFELVNAVTGPPGGPCPQDEEACSTTTPVKAMDIVKTVDVQQVGPGETAAYTITATNTGQVDYLAAEIGDDLTGVLDDATYNDDASASSGAVAYAEPTLTWTGDLLVGESVTITYSVTAGDPLPVGDGVLANVVTGPPGSPCPEDDEQCTTETPTRPLDFGDAPDSYGTMFESEGAYHAMIDGLRIGEQVNSETDGHPSAVADVDADDDGLLEVRGLFEGSTEISVDIQATNEGDTDAFLGAWPDLDQDGVHTNGSMKAVRIPAGSGTQVYTLTWQRETGLAAGETHLRLRLFGDLPEAPLTEASMAELSPIRYGGAGEVEDHYRTVGPPPAGPTPEPDGNLATTGADMTDLLVPAGILAALGATLIAVTTVRKRGEKTTA